MQFESIPSLFPGWNPNWRKNLSELALAVFGKAGGTFGAGVYTGTEELTTLSGTTTVASGLELGTHVLLGTLGKIATAASGLATGLDVIAHAGCGTTARQSAGQMSPLPPGWAASF